MKNLILALAIFAGAIVPAAAQTNVSVTIGQPGFYGTIDIGDYGPPPVFVAQPIIIERQVRYVEPIYLRVPPGHRARWSRYCGRYNACGRPVYFVRDDWYLNEYAPRYQRDYRARHHGDYDRRGDHYDRNVRREVVVVRDGRDGRDGRYDRDDRKHGKGHHKDKDKHHGRDNGRGHGRDH